ncbi:glycogen synthase GlgA [Jannaschia seohaensis]|uniref:Glycogen synthase n=1 Tax=Jannaschia seohaensis TaxID=475081 RepID=A0A2Y9AAS5_9RHOB|nr:glycogen synthase GlgA [Jannaschia seohaensis]PWJ21284.1 starch synthase [Jannaschia seohaensis]SSA41694.1 starch synthase [Jannaschia seohaensis]
MQILFVASECAPFVKTGGLADVIGAVPKALAPLGARVRVLLPAYPALSAQVAQGAEVMALDDLMGGPARVLAIEAQGVDLLLLDAPHLYDRPGNIYLGPDGRDWHDNWARFAALSRVGAMVAQGALGDWAPDVVNAHDWQAGLVPAYLAEAGTRVPSVVTIHNIAFQGVFGPEILGQIGLPGHWHSVDRGEYYGGFSYLKAGLMACDRITTVSPTYARELMRGEFGMGLDGVMRARRADLSGIVNGIDLDAWNPETDPALPAPYGARTLGRKAANRDALMVRFGLEPGSGPLFCVVSRLTEQKGLDLLLEAIPTLLARDARLALLGSGEKWMEDAFSGAAARHAGRIGTVIGYDEGLSHLMQGGSDAILIPSRFEPCGLTQLYGLRYGTVPVVARTGGLADTVIDANPAAIEAGVATGVQFSPIDALGLQDAINRTCDLFEDQTGWAAMQRRGMKQPVGWNSSAQAYLSLFRSLG